MPRSTAHSRSPSGSASTHVTSPNRSSTPGVLADVASDLEVAGPGFVNVTFSPTFLAEQLVAVAADDRLGVAGAPQSKTIVVDYSAPNVAKEMHAGHLRTTVIGDALVRMFTFLDHTVIRENHIGDWGRPFGMLIEHLLDIGEDVAADGLRQGDLDGFYKEANAKFTESEAFQERARERVVLLQAATPTRWRSGNGSSRCRTTTSTSSTASSGCCSPTTTSPARACTSR